MKLENHKTPNQLIEFISDGVKFKTNSLQMPSISGTVSVPLAELDKMRADHAAAVKIAQDLESKQGQVKVIYAKAERVRDWESEFGMRYPQPKYRTDYVEQGVEYKNFEDFREKIAEEERARVADKLKQKDEQITRDANAITSYEERIIKLRNQVDKLEDEKKEFEALKVTHEKMENELSLLKTQNSNLNESVVDAKREIRQLKRKKSFWEWLTTPAG